MQDESKLPCVLRKVLPPNLDKIKNGHYTEEDQDYPIHQYLKDNVIKVNEKGSEIVEFLKGKNILITGATGFLGKLLVEKLLRSCKDIGYIYIMVRTKKGKEPQQRVDEYLENWVFSRLSDIHPHYKEKVIGITADFAMNHLGLSEESRNIIREKVNIIYHMAATVRFDEKLSTAVMINIRGTQEMTKLAKECQRLHAFVHLSTAFSNCHQKYIKEEFYPPHLDPYKLMKVMDELPKDIVDQITPSLIGKAPNTYAFTKQIAEDLIRTDSAGIPTCIIRPSIVISCVREPIKSWIDNIYGPVGMILGPVVGLIHITWGSPNARTDVVPADYVINNCIAASYKTAKDRILDKVPIYNYISFKDNPITWDQMRVITMKQGVKVRSEKMLYKCFFVLTKWYYWYLILRFLLHTIPAYVADFLAIQFGKKPQLRKAYEKVDTFERALFHFMVNEWEFDNSNTKKLWESLNFVDKENFKFDMKTLNWEDYLSTYVVALRELLLLDPLDTLDAEKSLALRLDIFHYTTLTIITGLSIYFLLNTVFFFVPVFIITTILYYVIF